MANYQQRRITAIAVIATVCLVVGLWFSLRTGSPDSPPEETPDPKPPPIPQLTASPYLNTRPNARYIGERKCRECHPTAHESYRETSHSLALSDVEPEKEPKELSFHHKKSGRSFRVYQKDREVRHQEFVPAGDGKERLVLADFPIKYAIGSGTHARSYLLEIEGALYESPITWYPAIKKWDVSPGYDRKVQQSFSRPIDMLCLKCHVGRAESMSPDTGRLAFHEKVIGCENCHGPGSLHQEFRSKQTDALDGTDYTIVNPSKLSRELNEAVCAQCHMHGEGDAPIRGREETDFRPGLPLTDFRLDFRLDLPETPLTVTGHFGQMHNSRCYVESSTLTCTTCHNPHDQPKHNEKIAYYRAKCLSCHATDGGCKLPEPKRLAESPQNNCVQCHMKSANIRIPHLTFTNHRIGLKHKTKYEYVKSSGVALVPMIPPPDKLSQLDRDRCLGLAYMTHAGETEGLDAGERKDYRKRSFDLLSRVYAAGLRDGTVTSALAWHYLQQGSPDCMKFAREALRDEKTSSASRKNAMAVMASWHFSQQEYEKARDVLTTLVALRPTSEFWLILGGCYEQLNDRKLAAEALERAVAIRPDRIDVRRPLVEIYEQLGEKQRAEQHRRVIKRLEKPPP